VALRELTASHNALEQLPPGLLELPSLATVDVGTNKIRTIDATAARACRSLTRLDASNNELRDLPPELGLLQLNKLTLHGNPLRTLPSSVLNGPTPKLLDHLRAKIAPPPADAPATLAAAGAAIATTVERSGTELVLSGQGLRALPAGLCEREELLHLDLSANEIADLTNEIGWLQALRRLLISRNALRELPHSLTEMPALTELHADRNALSELPPALWDMPRLSHVSLHANRLTVAGLALPPRRASAPVRYLDVGENRLGNTPPLACLAALDELHLVRCGLQQLAVDALPLDSIVTLDLRDNDIGSLPPQLARATRLQSLGLSGNPLRSIPFSVQQKGAGAVLALLANRLPAEQIS